jgi:hypothetical protein
MTEVKINLAATAEDVEDYAKDYLYDLESENGHVTRSCQIHLSYWRRGLPSGSMTWC